MMKRALILLLAGFSLSAAWTVTGTESELIYSVARTDVLPGEAIRLDVLVENRDDRPIRISGMNATATYCGESVTFSRPALDSEGLIALPGLLPAYEGAPIPSGAWQAIPVTLVPSWANQPCNEQSVTYRLIVWIEGSERIPFSTEVIGILAVRLPATRYDRELFAEYRTRVDALPREQRGMFSVFSIAKERVTRATVSVVEDGVFSRLSDADESVAIAEFLDNAFSESEYVSRYLSMTRCSLSAREYSFINQLGSASVADKGGLEMELLPVVSSSQIRYLERSCAQRLRPALLSLQLDSAVPEAQEEGLLVGTDPLRETCIGFESCLAGKIAIALRPYAGEDE